MSELYYEGEVKKRPGLYRRYIRRDLGNVVAATDGVCAITIHSDWGPLNEVTVHDVAASGESISSIEKTYGNGGTVHAALDLLSTGVKTIYIVRIGEGGTAGNATLKDTASSDDDAVILSCKYSGKRSFTVTVRAKLGDPAVKEFIVLDGTTPLEVIDFESGPKEAATLVELINKKSKYFTAEEGAGNGEVATVSQVEVTVGTSPEVNTSDYSTGFSLLEPYKWNVLLVDTNDTAVHALAHEYIKRLYNDGGLPVCVIGEPTSVDLNTRFQNATAFNDEKIVYVGGAYKILSDNGEETVEGYRAAAVLGGMIAATTTNKSIVHRVISGAIDVAERFTPSQFTKAIESGCVLFDVNDSGQVWIDSGVNTLVTPADNQDEGWKKIKRTRLRFELLDRVDRTISPLIGRINCDNDGVANVIKLGTDVLDAMIREGKILPGASFYEDLENPHGGDSAWFVIDADDIDTLEKIYLRYRFRFKEN